MCIVPNILSFFFFFCDCFFDFLMLLLLFSCFSDVFTLNFLFIVKNSNLLYKYTTNSSKNKKNASKMINFQ